MEIILLTHIPKLGEKNSIVKVRPGFANNYLIPNGLAIVANKSNKKQIAENIKQIAHKEAKRRKQAEHLANKLQALNVTIQMQTGENGKIFGTVTPTQIKNTLKELGVDIETNQIKIVQPIKTIGKHPIAITLHPNMETEVQLNVESVKS